MESNWQRDLNEEPDYNKRKMIIFKHLESIRIDTSTWKERIEIVDLDYYNETTKNRLGTGTEIS